MNACGGTVVLATLAVTFALTGGSVSEAQSGSVTLDVTAFARLT